MAPNLPALDIFEIGIETAEPVAPRVAPASKAVTVAEVEERALQSSAPTPALTESEEPAVAVDDGGLKILVAAEDTETVAADTRYWWRVEEPLFTRWRIR